MHSPSSRRQPLAPTSREPLAAHLGVDTTLSDSTELAMPGALTRSLAVVQKRVGMLAGHMTHQLKQHEKAMGNTRDVFEQLLQDLNPMCDYFREAFALREVEGSRIYHEIDPDRSVGILNILWHTLSFTTRGNTKPLALHRAGREPLFTGRILALRGDFQALDVGLESLDFADLLQYELASLYLPAEVNEPAVMTIKHLGDEEHYFHQADAARLFMTKTVEMTCSGGFLHE